LVGGIISPALDGDSVGWERAVRGVVGEGGERTLIDVVTDGGVVDEADPRKILFDDG